MQLCNVDCTQQTLCRGCRKWRTSCSTSQKPIADRGAQCLTELFCCLCWLQSSGNGDISTNSAFSPSRWPNGSRIRSEILRQNKRCFLLPSIIAGVPSHQHDLQGFAFQSKLCQWQLHGLTSSEDAADADCQPQVDPQQHWLEIRCFMPGQQQRLQLSEAL